MGGAHAHLSIHEAAWIDLAQVYEVFQRNVSCLGYTIHVYFHIDSSHRHTDVSLAHVRNLS